MQDKMQSELERITNDANMGFITPFEAISQFHHALTCAGDDIESADERDAWRETVENSFFDAWCEVAKQWIES